MILNPLQATEWVPFKSATPLVTIGMFDGRHQICCQEIRGLPAVVGRSAFARIRVHDPWVSQVHCAIAFRDDGLLVVQDLESQHGTRVNGQLLRTCPLSEGDVLALGQMTTIVILQIAKLTTFLEST